MSDVDNDVSNEPNENLAQLQTDLAQSLVQFRNHIRHAFVTALRQHHRPSSRHTLRTLNRRTSEALNVFTEILNYSLVDFSQREQVVSELSRVEQSNLRDSVVRAQAELENTKKRLEREADISKRRALKQAAERLIKVADNFERAEQAIGDVEKTDATNAIAEGISLSIQTFRDALRDSGIEEFQPTGDAFDPEVHEAIAEVPQPNVESRVVLEVHRTGYRLNGELLRAAQVVVAKPA